MAAASVCARTGRVVLKRATPGISAKRLFTYQAAHRCQSLWLLPRSSATMQLTLGSRCESTVAEVAPSVAQSAPTGEFRDRYIPMTRRTLMQTLLQEPIFLTDDEKKAFEVFSLALDGAIKNQHKGLLAELKALFDPLNPDNDTNDSRRYNRRERLDNEFWLLQKLSVIMEKANFHELPSAIVEEVMKEHKVNDVLVSVHPEKYDVVRFWVVGRTPFPSLHEPWYRAIFKKLMGSSFPNLSHFYKRVVVAVRLKKDDRLFLKAFREVPVDRLDHLLPSGSIRMTKRDKGLLWINGGIFAGGVLGYGIAGVLGIQLYWPLLLSALSATSVTQLWVSFKSRQQLHLAEISKTLYFKNIINNRGLLTLLLDKAEDEIFKEILLTYAFLLTSRPPSTREKSSEQQKVEELGSMPSSLLQQKISDWIHFKTGAAVNFNPAEGIKLLSDLGILSKDSDENLHIVPLKTALKHLPQVNPTLSSRIEEYDLIEGFEVERSILEETEAEYSLAEKLRKRFRWS